MINSERRENIILWEQDSAWIFFKPPPPHFPPPLLDLIFLLRGFICVALEMWGYKVFMEQIM